MDWHKILGYQWLTFTRWIIHLPTLGKTQRPMSDICVVNVHSDWFNRYVCTGDHFQSDLDMLRFDFMVVKPCYMPPLFCFNVQADMICLLHHILPLIAYTFRENREFVSIITVQFMMSANSRIRFALQIVLICLYSTPSHYDHCANLSEDIELLKCLSDIFFSSV